MGILMMIQEVLRYFSNIWIQIQGLTKIPLIPVIQNCLIINSKEGIRVYICLCWSICVIHKLLKRVLEYMKVEVQFELPRSSEIEDLPPN